MKLLCDVMLGKLARYLRLLGFDTWYVRSEADLERCRRECTDRVFVTRRKTAGNTTTVIVSSEITRTQLRELKPLLKPHLDREKLLTRCIDCNRVLVPIDKTEIEFLVPEFVFHNYAWFKLCPGCKKVYWEGSHTKGMNDLLKEILE